MRGIPRSRGRSTRRWREVIRPAAYKRDATAQAPCWLCKQPIDYTIQSGEPDSWSPDHILTVRDHPELAEDLGNLAPSHLDCNKSRGKAQPTDNLGNTSRQW